VDIQSNPNNFHVGWTRPGEWLRYTIDVEEDCEWRARDTAVIFSE